MKQKINKFDNTADIFEETSGESKAITQKMARSRKYDRLRIMEDRVRQCKILLLRRVNEAEKILEKILIQHFGEDGFNPNNLKTDK